MDEGRYKNLTRVAVVLTVAWIGWSLYDSSLWESAPGGHELAAAGKYLEDGRYADALASFDKVLRLDPENLGALRGKAQALMQLGAAASLRHHEAIRSQNARAAEVAWRESRDYFEAALANYDESIVREEAGSISERNRAVLGVCYANRGILKDRIGDYAGALADYERALQLEPSVNQGPGLLTRFLRNQPERPPTVGDRARYLREQLAKPEAERLLRVPELDAAQRPFTM